MTSLAGPGPYRASRPLSATRRDQKESTMTRDLKMTAAAGVLFLSSIGGAYYYSQTQRSNWSLPDIASVIEVTPSAPSEAPASTGIATANAPRAGLTETIASAKAGTPGSAPPAPTQSAPPSVLMGGMAATGPTDSAKTTSAKEPSPGSGKVPSLAVLPPPAPLSKTATDGNKIPAKVIDQKDADIKKTSLPAPPLALAKASEEDLGPAPVLPSTDVSSAESNKSASAAKVDSTTVPGKSSSPGSLVMPPPPPLLGGEKKDADVRKGVLPSALPGAKDAPPLGSAPPVRGTDGTPPVAPANRPSPILEKGTLKDSSTGAPGSRPTMESPESVSGVRRSSVGPIPTPPRYSATPARDGISATNSATSVRSLPASLAVPTGGDDPVVRQPSTTSAAEKSDWPSRPSWDQTTRAARDERSIGTSVDPSRSGSLSNRMNGAAGANATSSAGASAGVASAVGAAAGGAGGLVIARATGADRNRSMGKPEAPQVSDPFEGNAAPIARTRSVPTAPSTARVDASSGAPSPAVTVPGGAVTAGGEAFRVVEPGTAASERFIAARGAGAASFASAARPSDEWASANKVKSYDVETYIALEGDSFDSIAGSLYKSRTLGAALARYNRMPTAAHEPLPGGRRLLIPPIAVLEGLQGPSRPGPAPTFTQAPVAASAAAGSRPPSAVPAPIANAVTSSAKQGAPTGAQAIADNSERTYKVERKETLYAIARKTLGDGKRWREILELNGDRVASEYDVPVGVTLRLPTGGK